MARFKKRNWFRDNIGKLTILAGALLLFFLGVSLGPVVLNQLNTHPAKDSKPTSSQNSTLPAEGPQVTDSYLLPTDTRYITYEDLASFTDEEITLIRNEIYARHGYDFQTQAIRAYFDAQNWYKPVSGRSGEDFDSALLNEYEVANVTTILAYERGEPAPFGENTPVEGNTETADIWTDSLSSKEDIKRYSFEMANIGDAVIFVSGLQNNWDGYSYHWRCMVYQDGSDKAIAVEDVRGYSINSGPAVLSLPGLAIGSYSIQMTCTNSANPFMTTFTMAPYEIRLIRYYHDTPLSYSDDGIQTFQKANEVVWSFDGTGFIKLNDGDCFGVLIRSNRPEQAIVPMLIGTDTASVEYVISSTGETVEAQGPWHCEEFDTDYYYSKCQYIGGYTDKTVETSSLPILYMDTNNPSSAVEQILNMQIEEKGIAEYGAIGYWWHKHGKGVLYGCGIVVVLFLWGLITGGGGGGDDDGGVYISETGSIEEAISEWWSDGM